MSDLFTATDDRPILDRSTLERWANCPMQALLVEQAGDGQSWEAASGSEAHQAISDTIRDYCDSNCAMDAGEIATSIQTYAMQSRPDVQPDVIKALRPFAYAFGKFIAGNINPRSIIAYDGGRGDKLAQYAMDLEYPVVRITSELDFLYAGPAPQKVHLIDWKTGHKNWTEQIVKDSFQFGMHSRLIFDRLPTVDCVEVSIWNTRVNRMTYAVPFYRSEIGQIDQRIVRAAMEWQKARSGKAEAWPIPEKCASCRVSLACAKRAPLPMEGDPVQMTDWLRIQEKAIDDVTDKLKNIVAARGTDIVTPHGNCFGFDKPKAARKPTAALYTTTAQKDED